MRQRVPCLAVLAFAMGATSIAVSAAPASESVASIRAEYNAIRGARKTLRSISKDIFGQSSEGAEAVAYVDDSQQVRLIEVTYYGETGRAAYEFYFRSSTLFFALELLSTYNAPMYLTPKKAAELSKEEKTRYAAFDEKKTKVIEHRYYFSGPVLLQHVGPPVAPDGSTWSDAEQSKRIRDAAAELLDEF